MGYRSADGLHRLSWGWIAWGEGSLAFDNFDLDYLEPFSHTSFIHDDR